MQVRGNWLVSRIKSFTGTPSLFHFVREEYVCACVYLVHGNCNPMHNHLTANTHTLKMALKIII